MLWKNNNILSLIVVALTTMATGMNAQSTSDYSDGVFFVNEDWYGHQNSTVNFLTNDGEWIYRVFQKENPDNQLGCTNQYGQIYGDRFYLVAKQEKDPGASVAGGLFPVPFPQVDKHTLPLIECFLGVWCLGPVPVCLLCLQS